jgi:hypothetical protein
MSVSPCPCTFLMVHVQWSMSIAMSITNGLCLRLCPCPSYSCLCCSCMYCMGVRKHLSVLICYFGLFRNASFVVTEHRNKPKQKLQFLETNRNIAEKSFVSVCLGSEPKQNNSLSQDALHWTVNCGRRRWQYCLLQYIYYCSRITIREIDLSSYLVSNIAQHYNEKQWVMTVQHPGAEGGPGRPENRGGCRHMSGLDRYVLDLCEMVPHVNFI